MLDFPISSVRQSFPALHNRENFVFFDNGAGAQVPQTVLDAVHDHLLSRNVQRGGRYRRSQEVDAAIQRARESVAIFLNAREPDEVAFGMNATSFIRLVSLGLSETLGDRREIVVTDLDHEANVATWLALQARGAEIRWWKMRPDGTLRNEDLEPLLNSRTRLVACAVASNALGYIVDVQQTAKIAHAAGAEIFLDAVHYAPHGPLDVQDLDCDYLVCSGYKIFAPHMGFLYGKRRALEALPTFREDFIPDKIPLKIEVGTFVYENVAGMDAAVRYLEDLGRLINPATTSRRAALLAATEAIRGYEAQLSRAMLDALANARAIVYGVIAKDDISRRTPTLCFNLPGISPAKVTEELAQENIGVRDGHMYSPRLMKRLGLTNEAGAVRASLVHYNTVEEVSRFGRALAEMTGA